MPFSTFWKDQFDGMEQLWTNRKIFQFNFHRRSFKQSLFDFTRNYSSIVKLSSSINKISRDNNLFFPFTFR